MMTVKFDVKPGVAETALDDLSLDQPRSSLKKESMGLLVRPAKIDVLWELRDSQLQCQGEDLELEKVLVGDVCEWL